MTLPPSPPALALSAETSPAVLAEVQSLQPRLPLQKLQSHLQTLSETLTETLSETGSFPSLQGRLHNAALTISHLLERTRTTLALFRAATTDNLDHLTLTRDLVADDLVPQAHHLLSKSAASNSRLSASCTSLALAFESAASSLSETLSEAHVTESEQRARVDQLREETTASYATLSLARGEHADADDKVTETNALYTAAFAREESARRRGHFLHAVHLSAIGASLVTTRTTALALSVTGAAALAAKSDQQAAQAREERAVHLRLRNDARDQRSAVGRKVAEIGERIRCTKREELLADTVLDGLAACVDVLRELAGVMVVVEGFWRDVGERVDGGIEQLVEIGAQLPEGERKKFWEGDKFRGRIERLEEFWTAVEVVCKHGLQGVRDVNAISGSDQKGMLLVDDERDATAKQLPWCGTSWMDEEPR